MKKVLSILLALCLLAAALPLSAAAEEAAFVFCRDPNDPSGSTDTVFNYVDDVSESKTAFVAATGNGKIGAVVWGGVDPNSPVQEDWISIEKESDTVWKLTITDNADTSQDFSFAVNVFAEGAEQSGPPAAHLEIAAHNVNNGGGNQDEEPLFVLCLDDEHRDVIYNNDNGFGYEDDRTVYLFTNGPITFKNVRFSPDPGQEGWATASILPDRDDLVAAITIMDDVTDEFIVTIMVDYVEQDGTEHQDYQFKFRAFNGQTQLGGGGNPELILIGIDNDYWGNQWVQWGITVGDDFYGTLGWESMDNLDQFPGNYALTGSIASLTSSDETVLKVTGPLGSAEPPAEGQPDLGPLRWHFEALKAGDVTLRITYITDEHGDRQGPPDAPEELKLHVAEPRLLFYKDAQLTQAADPDLFTYDATDRTLYIALNREAYPTAEFAVDPNNGVDRGDLLTLARIDATTATLTVKPGVTQDFASEGDISIAYDPQDHPDDVGPESFSVRFGWGEDHLFFMPCNWADDPAERFIIHWDKDMPRDSVTLGEEFWCAMFYGTLAEPGDPLSSEDWFNSTEDWDVLRVYSEQQSDASETSPPWVWQMISRYMPKDRAPVKLTLTSVTDESNEIFAWIQINDPQFALCSTSVYDPYTVINYNEWWYTDNSKLYLVSSDPNIRLSAFDIEHNITWLEDGDRKPIRSTSDDGPFNPDDAPFTVKDVENGNAITAYEITVKQDSPYAEKAWGCSFRFNYYWAEDEQNVQDGWSGFFARYAEPGLYAYTTSAWHPDWEKPLLMQGSEGGILAFVYFNGDDGSVTPMTPENSDLSVTVKGVTTSGSVQLDQRDGDKDRYQVLASDIQIRFFPEDSGESRFVKSFWQFFLSDIYEDIPITLTFTEKVGGAQRQITMYTARPQFYYATDKNASYPQSRITNLSFHYGATEEQKKVYLISTDDAVPSPDQMSIWINNNGKAESWVSYQQITNDNGKKVWEFTILRSRDRIGWVRVEGYFPKGTAFTGDDENVDPELGVLYGGFGAEHEHKVEYNCWEWASNTDQHWQVCKGCGEENPNTRAAHNTSGPDGACSVCGYKEVTVSTVSNGVVGEKGSGAGNVTVTGGTLNNQTSAVTINAGGNSVQYDSTALAAIKSEAGSQDVKLVVEEESPASSATDQTKAIDDAVKELQRQMADLETNPDVSQSLVDQMKVMHISLETGNTEIENFNGGTATVTVPYTVFSDVPQEDIRVYRVEENGELTQVTGRVNQDNTVTWETESHSYYMITPKVQADTERPVTPVTPAPSAPATTTATIPVSNDEASVSVEVTVSGDTATVSALTDNNIDKIVSSENLQEDVVFDLSSLEDVTTVSIPSNSFVKVADALEEHQGDDAVTVKTATGEATFDETAVAAIAEKATGGNVTLTFENVGTGNLNTAQKAALEGKELLGSYELTLTVNGQTVTNFEGGTATLSIPITLKSGESGQNYAVWYAARDGKLERRPTSFKNSVLIFTTTHFSEYVLSYENRPFADVVNEAWYNTAVYYSFDNGYFYGSSDTAFAPNGTMTRAMFATVLYRVAGEPEVTGTNPFTDVADGKWFTDGIVWAANNNIITGYGGEKFGPDDPITREQMVAIFWRYNNRPAGSKDSLSQFTDSGKISSWAKDAFEWAVSVGVISGKGNGILEPKGTAKRSEVAQIVMNYDTKAEKK